MTTIRNMDKLRRRLSQPDWVEKPAGSFLQEWRSFLQKEAAANAPVWHEVLRKSIRSAQDTRRFPQWARVFADSPEAEPMEYGTGLLYDGPGGPHQRYFPPPSKLREWSQSKGLNEYAVARGIWLRGGLEPRHYFRDAEQAADAHLNAWMATFARNIEHHAERMAAD